jgi:endonuclease III related protein
MFAKPMAELREQLLALNGVGPETADSILLYAGQRPVFVVDAYTRRMAVRHGLLEEDATYEEIRGLFERALIHADYIQFQDVDARGYIARLEAGANSRQGITIGSAAHSPSRMSMARRTPLVQVFNEMHGLIVSAGKQYCLKSKAQCDKCPLGPLLPTSRLSKG